MTTYSPNKLFFISGVSFLLGLIGVFLYCLYFSVNSLRQSLLLLFLILGVGVLIFYWSSRKYLGLMIFCCFCLGAARWLLIQPQLKPVNLDTLNRLEAMVLSAEDKDGRYQQLIVKPVNKILSKG